MQDGCLEHFLLSGWLFLFLMVLAGVRLEIAKGANMKKVNREILLV